MALFFKLSFLLGGISALFIGFFVYFQNRHNTLNRTFLGMSLGSAIWSLGFLGMMTAESMGSSERWRWFMESGSTLIPAFWMHFIYTFLGIKDKKRKLLAFIYAGSIFVWLLNLSELFYKGIFTTGMIPKSVFPFYPTASLGYVIFLAFFIVVAVYSIFELFRFLIKSEHTISTQIKYLMAIALLGYGGGGMTFLLTFNINVPPYGVILFTFYPIIISYAIAKHHIFDIKAIVTELLVAALAIVTLVRSVVAETAQDRFINVLLFAFTVMIGVFLIRSVLKEIKQREHIEKLAGELGVANERLKMLDQQKSEFVSLASHQLRSPLTAIKGYTSMILEGSFGAVPEKMKQALDRVFQSSQNLVALIEDFLNLSRIEQGRMKYEFTSVDLKKLVKDVIDQLMPNVTNAGLTISLETDGNKSYLITGDVGKIKQVIGNIVDNAIKYTPKGSIKVNLSKNNDIRKVYLRVADTGIGFSHETSLKLFEKFSRADAAGKISASGTGLGLYVAREIMKAHRGNIWAESPGEGKGSVFSMEFLAE